MVDETHKKQSTTETKMVKAKHRKSNSNVEEFAFN